MLILVVLYTASVITSENKDAHGTPEADEIKRILTVSAYYSNVESSFTGPVRTSATFASSVLSSKDHPVLVISAMHSLWIRLATVSGILSYLTLRLLCFSVHRPTPGVALDARLFAS